MCSQKNASYMSKENNLTNNVSQRRKNLNLNQFPVWRIASAKFTRDVHSWCTENECNFHLYTHTHWIKSLYRDGTEEPNYYSNLYSRVPITHRSNEVWGVHMMYFLHICEHQNKKLFLDEMNGVRCCGWIFF